MSQELQFSGAEMVIKALTDQGVDVIFGYPGGAVLPIYDALFKQNHVRHILVRHEQAAVHAADGYARATGEVGVALVTSGPGVTNAITGRAGSRRRSSRRRTSSTAPRSTIARKRPSQAA